MIGSTNAMVDHYEEYLKKAIIRIEGFKKREAKSPKIFTELEKCLKNAQNVNSTLRKENEVQSKIIKRLSLEGKKDKKRLRDSRLLEIENKRQRTEERMRTRMEAKLGKLKKHCEETKTVNEKRSFLGQAVCVRDIYADLIKEGEVIPSEQVEFVLH